MFLISLGLAGRFFTTIAWEALASASVLPMNIQGWFPLGLTGLFSLQSKGLSRVFYALFIIYWLSFISSRSLLNLSYIFLILVSRLFICDSILISRFWINFTIIIQNSLSGRFPISSSFVWFGGHLSCSFICWLFLCLFILFKLLSLGCLYGFLQFLLSPLLFMPPSLSWFNFSV